MLKATHKVLEFLIRRYHIHEHNTDSVIECILPYHETKYFSRMLQLTKLPAGSRWEFLGTAQKSNAALARLTLIQRCLVDAEVLVFVAECAKRQAELARGGESHKTAMTLFTVVTLEVISRYVRHTRMWSCCSCKDHLSALLSPLFIYAHCSAFR